MLLEVSGQDFGSQIGPKQSDNGEDDTSNRQLRNKTPTAERPAVDRDFLFRLLRGSRSRLLIWMHVSIMKR